MYHNGQGWPSTAYFLSATRLNELARAHAWTHADARLFATLCDHDFAIKGRRKGRVWPRVESLAAAVGVCERTVRRALAKFAVAGLVSREVRGRGRSAMTWLHWDAICPAAEKPDTGAMARRDNRTSAAGPYDERPARKKKQEAPGFAEAERQRLRRAMPPYAELVRRYGQPPGDLAPWEGMAWYARQCSAAQEAAT